MKYLEAKTRALQQVQAGKSQVNLQNCSVLTVYPAFKLKLQSMKREKLSTETLISLHNCTGWSES